MTPYEWDRKSGLERIYQNTDDAEERDDVMRQLREIDGETAVNGLGVPDDVKHAVEVATGRAVGRSQ